MDAKKASDIEHWRAFVRAISEPGAVVQIDVPHKLECGNTVWDGHAFGASTQVIKKRIEQLEALEALALMPEEG